LGRFLSLVFDLTFSFASSLTSAQESLASVSDDASDTYSPSQSAGRFLGDPGDKFGEIDAFTTIVDDGNGVDIVFLAFPGLLRTSGGFGVFPRMLRNDLRRNNVKTNFPRCGCPNGSD